MFIAIIFNMGETQCVKTVDELLKYRWNIVFVLPGPYRKGFEVFRG